MVHGGSFSVRKFARQAPIAITHQKKITFEEMRAAGVRGLLIYCSDYKCAHHVEISADRWPDNVRLSDLEPLFVCQVCGTRGGDIRPDFDWDKGAQIAPRPSSLTVWAYVREAGSHTPAPDVPITTWRTRMSPGRTLVPYARAGTPAVDDTGTTGRTVTAGPAPVCGVSGADNTGNNGEKSRDQKGSHSSLHQERI